MEKRQVTRIYGLACRIEDAILLIQSQQARITSPDYFLSSLDGQFALSGVCMQLSFIGETVKVMDQHASEFLAQYPSIPWKQVKGLRDIVVHEYHNIDHEEIYQIITTDLPLLLNVIRQMKADMERLISRITPHP
ncbi:MAG: DUF86 domain-containing protein [Paludibacteraceae bacterium]|nr:DUF86 domain-containing protein [Paludibacteraceae bacterium]